MALQDISDPLDLLRIESPDFYNFWSAHGGLDVLRWDTAAGITDINTIEQNLQQLPYWQNTSDSARAHDWLSVTDPAQASKDVQTATTNVGDIATRLGYQFADTAEYLDFVNQAVREGWDETQTRAAIMQRWAVRELGGNDVTTYAQMPGELGNEMTKVLNLGHQYGVPMTPQNAGSLASQVFLGTASEDSITQDMRNWAKGYYSGNTAITNAIDQGQTVMQFADPYIQMAAKELEINPATVDFTDPKWNVALNGLGKSSGDVNPVGSSAQFGSTPSGAGKDQGRAPMSLQDWQTQIRTNPMYGFDNTTNARTQSAQFSTQLMQEFGATG